MAAAKKSRMRIPSDARPSQCKGCGGRIFWVESAGKKRPANPDGTDHQGTCSKPMTRARPSTGTDRIASASGGYTPTTMNQTITVPDPGIRWGQYKVLYRVDRSIFVFDTEGTVETSLVGDNFKTLKEASDFAQELAAKVEAESRKPLANS